MTETHVQFRREGDPAFPIEERETTTAADEGADDTATVDTTTVDKPPFNEDPKVQEYIGRQVEKRVADVETKLRDEFKGNVEGIKKEIGEQRQKNAEQTKIPAWFGGNQAQWDDYRAWTDEQLKGVEDRAISRTFEQAKTQDSAQKKAVEEATEYFRGELAVIQADKTLNPSGKTIDPNKLLKTVMDNDLVDSKGRWNYRAGMRLLNSHSTAVHTTTVSKEKKDLAAATMDGSGGAGGERKPKSFKTPEDFRKKRPW